MASRAFPSVQKYCEPRTISLDMRCVELRAAQADLAAGDSERGTDMGVTKMYANREPNGTWTMRQERYRGRKKEHPHDVCAVARSFDELRDMCERHWQDAFKPSEPYPGPHGPLEN
jgi:hypothetical protein